MTDRVLRSNLGFDVSFHHGPFMSNLRITAGPFIFEARFETALAPRTCEIFRKLLPYTERVIHVRWSGEAVWIPLGDTDMGVPAENQTSYPAPGQMILYP